MEKSKSSNRRGFFHKLVGLAALGSIAGLFNITRPEKVHAEGETVVVGGEYTTAASKTLIQGDVGSSSAVIEGIHTGSYAGIRGRCSAGWGVRGDSDSFMGTAGYVSGNGVGVGGYAQGYNTILTTAGVNGGADTGTGVKGESNSGNGVEGFSDTGFGVLGKSSTTGTPYSQGVVGLTENLPAPFPGAVGVHGAALTGTGVQGNSSGGAGVLGVATTGIGVGGWSWDVNGKALVARGWLGQIANLQEWWDFFGTTLSSVSKDGYLGIGTNSPSTAIHVKSSSSNPAIRLENEGNHVGQFIYCYSNSHIPFFSGRRARGTTTSPSQVQTDDTLMRYGGSGYGTSSFPGGNRAILEFKASETWTDVFQGTYITFSTTQTGSTTTAERMRITPAGEIIPPTDNSGSIGTESKRWGVIRGIIIQSGDLVFENGVKATEEGDGLAFLNKSGQKIAILDSEGNLRIKGKLIEEN